MQTLDYHGKMCLNYVIIGYIGRLSLDKKKIDCKIVNIVLPVSFNIYVFGAQKICLTDKVLLSIRNICFGEIEENYQTKF